MSETAASLARVADVISIPFMDVSWLGTWVLCVTNSFKKYPTNAS